MKGNANKYYLLKRQAQASLMSSEVATRGVL